MAPSALKSAVTVEINDENALTRTAVEMAARAIDSLVQDSPKLDEAREFKIEIGVNGTARPAFLEQATLHKGGTITAEARVVVFTSTIEGTLYLIDLSYSEQRWSAKLNKAMAISND